MSRPGLACIAFAGVALAPGCAADRQPFGQQVEAITVGSASAEDTAIVALSARRVVCPQPEPAVLGSGVVIGPGLVITAAHTLAVLFDDGSALDDLEIFNGAAAPAGPGEWRTIRAARMYPGYEPETGAGDLALLLLDSDLADVEPVALGSLPADDSAVGRVVRLVGFGADEPGGQPGERRTGTALIESYDDTTVRLLPAPGLSCGGDSGGAVLLDDGGGERLIAVIRSGDLACSQYGVATRVDAHAEFIAPVIDGTEPLIDLAAPLPDPDADYCVNECSTTADCPFGMRCINDRTAWRCAYPLLGTGTFGEACSSSDDCGGGLCAGVGSGAAHECRCLDACLPAEDAPEDGCAAGGSRTSGATALLLVLLSISLAQRRRRARGAPRRL